MIKYYLKEGVTDRCIALLITDQVNQFVLCIAPLIESNPKTIRNPHSNNYGNLFLDYIVLPLCPKDASLQDQFI